MSINHFQISGRSQRYATIVKAALATAVAAIVLCFAGITAFVQAQTTTVDFPQTVAGQKLEGFVTAFNSGDKDAWRSWIQEDPRAVDSPKVFERRMQFFENVYGDLGGIDVSRITQSSEYVITALVHALRPTSEIEWVNMTMTFDSLPPHGWQRFSLRPTDGPDDNMPEGKLTDEQIAQNLDEYISGLVDRDRFSGAVLIAHNGRPVFEKAYGEACKRYSVPNKIDTKFNLGSMNKMFTGVAIAQLAQEGKLSFDDKVGKYLPDYPNKEVAEKVTIHQLLTHTSGLGNYWGELFDSRWWEVKTVQQYADLFADKPLESEPGAKFSYSNAGPIVLGLIIEKITGQSYYDYVKEHIYKPAGMINSGCFEVDRDEPNLAIGYTHRDYDGSSDPDHWRNNLFLHAIKGGPAGGGYSTVEDLVSFATALQNHVLLNKEYTDIVTTGKVPMGPDAKYAYLFGDETKNGHRFFGHNGGAPGINAELSIFPESDYVVAVLANYDGAASMVASRARALIAR